VPRPQKKSDPIIEKEWRIMISGYFRQTLKYPPKEDWGGPGGTIAKILDTFRLPEGAQPRIERLLEYVVIYKKRGQVYTGERKMGQGAKSMINSPYEYQITIDVVEQQNGTKMALLLLNQYHHTTSLESVGLTTVLRTINRLRPVIHKIPKRKQGNKEVHSPWANARVRWATQLLVR
jgi:hypothetical protein